ncbi:hypothetical protein DDI_1587 [Dickeya dianthicola RNS04.9]|nr:hypothetical protein DDI_1587 [Dickeya dianthicola RNS04.9]
MLRALLSTILLYSISCKLTAHYMYGKRLWEWKMRKIVFTQ